MDEQSQSQREKDITNNEKSYECCSRNIQNYQIGLAKAIMKIVSSSTEIFGRNLVIQTENKISAFFQGGTIIEAVQFLLHKLINEIQKARDENYGRSEKNNDREEYKKLEKSIQQLEEASRRHFGVQEELKLYIRQQDEKILRLEKQLKVFQQDQERSRSRNRKEKKNLEASEVEKRQLMRGVKSISRNHMKKVVGRISQKSQQFMPQRSVTIDGKKLYASKSVKRDLKQRRRYIQDTNHYNKNNSNNNHNNKSKNKNKNFKILKTEPINMENCMVESKNIHNQFIDVSFNFNSQLCRKIKKASLSEKVSQYIERRQKSKSQAQRKHQLCNQLQRSLNVNSSFSRI